MHLRDVAAGQHGTTLSLPLLVEDRDLVREIQARLTIAGLLDPPADGFLGPVSGWALATYLRAVGEDLQAGITARAAGALRHPGAGNPFPMDLGDDLAGRIVGAILHRGGFVATHPDLLTVAYVEGMHPDGTLSANRPDAFDDARFLIAVEGGRPVLRGAWEATTSAGRPFVEDPPDPRGALRIALGQHKAWVVGMNSAGRPGEHEALVQVEDLPVHRDGNGDFRRDGDPVSTGRFDLHQHGGEDAPRDWVGKASAGCLVGRTMAGHRAFMALVKTDARYRACNAYRFVATVLGAEEVVGGAG